jgi:hypothetical protein
MILGAFLSVDLSSAAFALAFQMEEDGVMVLLTIGGVLFVTGLGIMAAAYRKFRYGEIFEYRGHHKKDRRSKSLLKQFSDVSDILEIR